MKILPKYDDQSGYGLMTALLVLLVIAVLALELGTDFLEKMGGKFMQWTNRHRPMTGTTWEYQSQSAAAMQQLSEVVSTQDEIRRELQSMEDFALLPQQLEGSKILTVSKAKFLELYYKLPKVYAERLCSPLQLMEYSVIDGWNRIAFAGFENRVDLYFLTGGNYVLKKISLEQSFFDELERWGRQVQGELNSYPDFEDRVYSASEFIDALESLEDDYDDFISEIGLLKSGSTLVNVGISRRWVGGTVEIGFQYADDSIRIYPVPDELAFQLLDYMSEHRNQNELERFIPLGL
jgi:hypothetical protein